MYIIGKKVKPNTIKLYRSAINELESYSLLKLTATEAHMLIDSLGHDPWKLVNNQYVTTYSKDGGLDKLWNVLVKQHKESNPDTFFDVSSTYSPKVSGTSVLIRDSDKHIITIAYRGKLSKCGINQIFIDDVIREKFFADTHHSKYYKKTHKFGIDFSDLMIYTKWSDYMNKVYVNNMQRR